MIGPRRVTHAGTALTPAQLDAIADYIRQHPKAPPDEVALGAAVGLTWPALIQAAAWRRLRWVYPTGDGRGGLWVRTDDCKRDLGRRWRWAGLLCARGRDWLTMKAAGGELGRRDGK